jgi:hypothetical protein
MINPRLIDDTLDTLRPGWRERRAKRKSPWNLLCVFLGFGIAVILMNYFCRAALWLHILIYPAHAALSTGFFAFLNKSSSPSLLLIALPLFVPALVCGGLIGNVITWFIPPARRAMEVEAAGDKEMTFLGSNAGLLKFGGIASAVCVILSLIGILTLRTVT